MYISRQNWYSKAHQFTVSHPSKECVLDFEIASKASMPERISKP